MKILVVDNRSSDTTKAVVANAQIAYKTFRYIYEPYPGKSYAYSRGMDEARENIFLFTDDDFRLPVDWIEGMCDPILSGLADAVAGGIVVA